MRIEVIKEKISADHLKTLTEANYGDMIKGVADIRQNILALGGELHADAEALLLEQGCRQEDLWGFNIHPGQPPEAQIEFTSFINIRPRQGNRSIDIKDEALKNKIRTVIRALVAS